MKNLLVFLTFTLFLAVANSNIDFDGSNSDQKWVTVKGAPIGAYSGRVVSNIGDFNGDGIDDILINAANALNSEQAYVIYGQKDGFSQDTVQVDSTFSEGFTIHGPFVNSQFTNFGYSISKAIDLNGDGLSDIVLGAPSFNNYQGMVYVIYGKKSHTGDITINQDYSFPSPVEGFAIFGVPSSRLGYSVGSAGDFNGDGFDDLLIGAPELGGSQGAVYVIYGKNGKYTSNIDLQVTQAGFTILGPTGIYSSVGEAVDGVGDINGDGVDDILVGAPGSYTVYGLYGKKNRVETSLTVDANNLATSKGFVISSSSYAGKFGTILSSAGDFNKDGIQDIILGTSTKGALVYYGQKENWSSFDIDTSDQGFRIKDSRIGATTKFGLAASGGDLNGDGIDDILVRGDYIVVLYGSETTRRGDFDMSTDFTVDQGFLISGSAFSWRLSSTIGTSMTTGDFNNDGLDDLLIGAPNSETFAGKAYIAFGTNGCPRYCSTCEETKCLTCFSGYRLVNSVCEVIPGTTPGTPGGEATTVGLSSCSTTNKERQADAFQGLFDGASAISNVIALGSSMPTNFGLVARILKNSKYLDLSMSEDLQETFCAWKVDTGIFPAPEDSNEGSLPLMFERYGMKSAFLINYWKTFTIILLGLVIGSVCFIISKVTWMKETKIPRILVLMTSNFVLAQFYGSIDEIFFDFLIDARSSESASSGSRTFGFILAIFLLLVGFGVTGLHGVILSKYHRIKKGPASASVKVDSVLQFLKKHEKIKLFVKDFKDTTPFTQAFLLINITRSLLSSFIFAMLFDHPLLQISLLIVLNLSVLVYLVVKKPFKDLANTCAQYFCEGLLFVSYLSILVLASMNERGDGSSTSIKGFSMTIIVCNAMLLIGCAIFMLVNLVILLNKIYKEHLLRKSAVAPIDSPQKLAESPSSKPHDHSKNLGNSSSYFPDTSSSPNLGPRKPFRRGTSTGSPTLIPSMVDNSPELGPSERGDPSMLQLNLNNNSERIKEESPLDEETSRQRSGSTTSLRREDIHSRLSRMKLQRVRGFNS